MDPSSPFGGIPRNWKRENVGKSHQGDGAIVPPSGGSLEIGNDVDVIVHSLVSELFPLRGDP